MRCLARGTARRDWAACPNGTGPGCRSAEPIVLCRRIVPAQCAGALCRRIVPAHCAGALFRRIVPAHCSGKACFRHGCLACHLALTSCLDHAYTLAAQSRLSTNPNVSLRVHFPKHLLAVRAPHRFPPLRDRRTSVGRRRKPSAWCAVWPTCHSRIQPHALRRRASLL
jgi:hypothetical protein